LVDRVGPSDEDKASSMGAVISDAMTGERKRPMRSYQAVEI
jgi:hypothetical protein